MKSFWLFLVLSVVSLSQVAADAFEILPAKPDHLHLLQAGGYVVFVRHGPTDSAKPDQVPIDLHDCSTQRPLTDEGRELMATVAEGIKRAGFPLGAIHTSPLCRAVETTEILFGSGSYTVERDLMYVAALTSIEKQPIIARTRALLSEPVPSNENRILVAHGPNLVEVMDYFPVEGAVVIFQPDPEGMAFTYLATIEPGDWADLLSLLE